MKDCEFRPATQAERLAASIADSVSSGGFPLGFRLDETALTERFQSVAHARARSVTIA